MTSDQQPPQGTPPEAPAASNPQAAHTRAETAAPKKVAARPKQATKAAAKSKVEATKSKGEAPKQKAATTKSQTATPKPAASKAITQKPDATGITGDKPAKPKVSAAKTPPADTAANTDQLAKQQAAAEKARIAKAKLAKIASAKAKQAPAATDETDAEPAALVSAAVTGAPAVEVVAPAAAPTVADAETESVVVAKPAATKGRRRVSLPSAVQGWRQKLPHYIRLMRLDKPIGILLLLWPTLWALWLAAKGTPSLKNLVIFSLGVVLMRSAGCVINDFADRKIDGHVARTSQRPLATGAVTSREALILFVALCLTAFALVLCTDPLTIKLSVGGLLLAASYPFMKRHTHLPQVVLGAAFAWGVPMAYAAEIGKLDKNMWVIYLAVVLWTVAYDTFYAMVDRDDDLKIGVKSTAILFGEQDRVITGMLQAMMLYAMVLVGKAAELGWIYYLGLVVAAGLFAYQQWLIRYRERQACFKAFLNNNWAGAAIFVGIAADLALK